MTIPSRWKCKECDCINEKHPAFNVYLPDRKKASGPDAIGLPGASWQCTKCRHPASSHKFTFEKSDDEDK